MLRITLCTWCYMQLVQCVLANLWYGALCPSLGAPRTTYVSEAALCTLCGVRYVHSTLVCSAVAVLLFAPHVACAQRLDSLHKPHAVVCACLTLAHAHHTLRRCPAWSLMDNPEPARKKRRKGRDAALLRVPEGGDVFADIDYTRFRRVEGGAQAAAGAGGTPSLPAARCT